MATVPEEYKKYALKLSIVVVAGTYKLVRGQRSGIDTIKYPHLTQDTNGKVTNSQLYTTNKSQEARPFPAGDQKAQINRCAQRQNKHKTEKNP